VLGREGKARYLDLIELLGTGKLTNCTQQEKQVRAYVDGNVKNSALQPAERA